jgi:high-affinity Fe2+/Pb2+ permease
MLSNYWFQLVIVAASAGLFGWAASWLANRDAERQITRRYNEQFERDKARAYARMNALLVSNGFPPLEDTEDDHAG